MSSMTETIVDNVAHARAKPVLSVLTPFKDDDPTELLAALETEARHLAGSVELVLLDDGSSDTTLGERVAEAIWAMTLPVRLVRLSQNEGRALGRNRLAAHARGSTFLFLDADMRPDDERFLRAWADLVAMRDPPVAFGGFSLKQAPSDPKFAVHRAMAQRGECLSYDVRARQPEKYVFTSNLLVRRDAFEAEDFSSEFRGWGWEDVEWGMRIARRYTVLHVDNPATHLGLDTVATLAGKYEQSVDNFARVVRSHPEVVATYPSYRAARALKRTPALPLWRGLFKRMALLGLLPTAARAFSLRLYRAALYAEAV